MGLMDQRYDVIVVGAGPIGSYTASQLAQAGFKVALLEQNEQAGEKVVCAGIIGVEAFRRFRLPQKAVLSPVTSLTFHSPGGLSLRYAPEKPFACLTDRSLLEEEMLRQAREAGTDIHLGKKVHQIKVRDDLVEVKINGRHTPDSQVKTELQTVQAQVIILATGVDYQFHSGLGLGYPTFFLQGAQTEVRSIEGGKVEIHLGNHLPPGSFAWIIPSSNQHSRIGLLSPGNARATLKRFLKEHLDGLFSPESDPILQRRTAQGFVGRIASHRVLAVGEAAGQIKATSGGGVFYGLLGSRILVQVLKDAFKRSNFTEKGLADYRKLCQKEIGREVKMGLYIRTIWKRLKDRDIDRVFRLIQRSVGETVQETLDFEYHSSTITRGLRLLQAHLPALLRSHSIPSP